MISISLDLMSTVVNGLLFPVVITLLALVLLTLWESGLAIGERSGGLARIEKDGCLETMAARARRRIDRADLLARIGPMLGLMGTLIPLGPGLAALSRGDLEVLAEAVTVAFNTTVLGLLIGILGFVIGRLRRRWYDAAMGRLEARS
ncbi:small-conductance mechanosensitive channel [Natronospira proteinivora]|uniref:Small-conductance mechanosensitive channel n=1 Tax=Natronospira proteinivora TaxID=1807133 RepID=A0ABT1G6B3_9GAMM|nr:MotA/TolQ/ExbB proton channel family protein [Natronospira proteinivora]MCP1726839.1 small-conductance mechanosensitive channel [Natronospira proteinivora]